MQKHRIQEKARGFGMSQIANKEKKNRNFVRLLFPQRKGGLKTKVPFMMRHEERNMNSYDRTNWTSDCFITLIQNSR